MPSGPSYSEEEVALILRRAAELQQEQPAPGDPRSLSLPEIERAAAEAGLSQALVRRAATELRRSAPPKITHNAFLGGPTQIVVERTVIGEFPSECFDHLLEVIGFAGTVQGRAATIGQSLTWNGMLGSAETVMLAVTVSVRLGETRLRVEAKLGSLAGAIFGGIGGGVGGGLGWAAFGGGALLGGPLASIALGFGFLGGVYALCRRLYRSQSQQHAASVHKLADELERVIKGQLSMAAITAS